MTRLILVRHGLTEWNLLGRRCGHTDVPLAPEGLEQVRRACERLRRERIDAAWASDLSRAIVTAQTIAEPHGVPVQTTPLLREIHHGAYEGLTAAEAPASDRAPDSEDPADVMARVVEARQMLQRAYPDGNVLVAGHLGPLRMLLCDAIGAPVETRRRFCMENGSVSIIEWNGELGRLRLVNDTLHLG